MNFLAVFLTVIISSVLVSSSLFAGGNIPPGALADRNIKLEPGTNKVIKLEPKENKKKDKQVADQDRDSNTVSRK